MHIVVTYFGGFATCICDVATCTSGVTMRTSGVAMRTSGVAMCTSGVTMCTRGVAMCICTLLVIQQAFLYMAVYCWAFPQYTSKFIDNKLIVGNELCGKL
jgi:hypothetical protein